MIGPHPDADDYASYWRARLVSEPKATPRVPLPEEKLAAKQPTKEEPKKPRSRKKRAG